MTPIRGLFETHLPVADLQRSVDFYGGVLGLDLARVFPERHVVFYWIGGPSSSISRICSKPPRACAPPT
jgi:lactoylglutathione lyase